jgi:sugar phosphate isomerase/epimerase
MLRAISTYVGVKDRLHPAMLDSLVKGGAQAIELFCARQHFDYREKSHIKEIAHWFKSNPVVLNSLHSPMYSDTDWGSDGSHSVNIADLNKRQRIESMDEIKRALEVAEILPFKYLVQHLGDAGEEFDQHKLDAIVSSIEHLRAFAKPLGVSILIENIPNELSTPDRLIEVIKGSHFNDVGVCFDFGHAHIHRNVVPDFEVVKAHVRSTHVHDNARDKDDHRLPGQGTLEWKSAMEAFKTAPNAPPLLLEIAGPDGMDLTSAVRTSFKKLGEDV